LIASVLKKEREKGKEVLIKRKRKSRTNKKKNKERKGSKEKNSEVLASFCGLVVSCFVVCLN
jgi:hypothetical protein